MLNPTLSEVVFSLLVVAMGSVVLFLFIVVIKKFRLDRLNNKEVGALMLVCFLSGIILEAYLAGDQSMEAFGSIAIILFGAWLYYLSIKRGWVFSRPQGPTGGG